VAKWLARLPAARKVTSKKNLGRDPEQRKEIIKKHWIRIQIK
jgi:hypothetical protein